MFKPKLAESCRGELKGNELLHLKYNINKSASLNVVLIISFYTCDMSLPIFIYS